LIFLRINTTMRCDYCPETFDTTLEWRQHISHEINHNIFPVPTTCLNCNEDLEDKFRLGVHLNTRVCRDSTFPKDKCYHCFKHFTTPSTLARHVTRRVCFSPTQIAKLLANKHHCFICTQDFDSHLKLLQHTQMHNCTKRPSKKVPKKVTKTVVKDKQHVKFGRIKKHDWLSNFICTLPQLYYNDMSQMNDAFLYEIFI
jgi:hypothetical protein